MKGGPKIFVLHRGIFLFLFPSNFDILIGPQPSMGLKETFFSSPLHYSLIFFPSNFDILFGRHPFLGPNGGGSLGVPQGPPPRSTSAHRCPPIEWTLTTIWCWVSHTHIPRPQQLMLSYPPGVMSQLIVLQDP